jgi:hypothetical protein
MLTGKLERAIREPDFAIRIAWMTAIGVVCCTTLFVLLGRVRPGPWAKIAPVDLLFELP